MTLPPPPTPRYVHGERPTLGLITQGINGAYGQEVWTSFMQTACDHQHEQAKCKDTNHHFKNLSRACLTWAKTFCGAVPPNDVRLATELSTPKTP